MLFRSDVQAQIPVIFIVVHNFIHKHDPEEILKFIDILEDLPAINEFGDLVKGHPTGRAATRKGHT